MGKLFSGTLTVFDFSNLNPYSILTRCAARGSYRFKTYDGVEVLAKSYVTWTFSETSSL
jgi:hypothetical protein